MSGDDDPINGQTQALLEQLRGHPIEQHSVILAQILAALHALRSDVERLQSSITSNEVKLEKKLVEIEDDVDKKISAIVSQIRVVEGAIMLGFIAAIWRIIERGFP